MLCPSRRRFLQLSAGAGLAAGFLPAAIARAAAIPASRRAGTLEDVEHIVVFMQENRSFDHYFGQMRGVRGHGDRFPTPLPSGRPVWFQPRQHAPGQTILPFHLDTRQSAAQCVPALDHSWTKTHAALNGGRHDNWPAWKTDLTMGYYRRDDIPFHYALADAFTVCDHYFCSFPGATHPNRFYLMTGMIDPTGAGGGPLMDNNDIVDVPQLPPFTWTTYPERLQAAGISWQVYQQGTDFDEKEGNYGTNVLANFRQYIEAPEGSALHSRAMTARRLETLAEDVKADRLPQVSWILPPAAYSEHPKYMPAMGAWYISRILDALTVNPEVWSKTAFFITYDENDGYFDHVPPPMPPTPTMPGKSTVDAEDEIHDVVNPAHQPIYHRDRLPYGLGPRVPMIVLSPWSKGGFVCSQVFDHTSVIRFIEARFGVAEPNISAWRRAICGDLTSAFDFSRAEAWSVSLPDAAAQRDTAEEACRTLARTVPPDATDAMAPQEPGTRPARPLPYALQVEDKADGRSVTLTFLNQGAQGAHFLVYASDRADGPRRYSVEAGKSLSDSWTLESGGYALSVHGPNGFFRAFHGRAGQSAPAIKARYDGVKGDILLTLENPTDKAIDCTIRDNAYGAPPHTVRLEPGVATERRVGLDRSAQWYDLTVTVAGTTDWYRRLAGHVETGRASSTDPAAGAPVLI